MIGGESMSAKQKEQHAVEAKTKEKQTAKNVEDHTVTEEITAVLEEIIEEPKPEKVKGEIITFIDEKNFLIGEQHYRLVKDRSFLHCRNVRECGWRERSSLFERRYVNV